MDRWLLLAVALALVAGCAVQEDPERSDVARSPRALACTDLATATCERYAACAPLAARAGPGEGATCVAALREHCLRTTGIGGSTRTVEAVSACAGATRALACPTFLARYPEVCDPLPGALGVGAPCAFDEQCATQFCARQADTACGTCIPPRVAGASCVGGACGGGLACNTANQCTRPGALGEACGPNVPCERLLFCDVDRCSARHGLGEACAGVGQCDLSVLATCSESYRCRAGAVVPLGEPCTLTATGLTLCEAPARCINDRCVAGRAEGEACTSAHECDGFGAECIRGRCVLRRIETCAQK